MEQKELRRKIFDKLDDMEENYKYLAGTLCSNWASTMMLMQLYYWDNYEDLKEER